MKTTQERGDTAAAGSGAPGAGNAKASAGRPAQRRGDGRARLERFFWRAVRSCRAYRREE